MKRIFTCVLIMCQIMWLGLPKVMAQNTPSLAGTYYADNPEAFIQSFTFEGKDIDIHIHPGWTSIPETRMMEFFQFNYRLQESKQALLTTGENQTEKEVDSFLDMTQVLKQLSTSIDHKSSYGDLIYAIESQVPGLYFHTEDMFAPFFHISMTEVNVTDHSFTIKVLNQAFLELVKLSDTSFSLDNVTYALNGQFPQTTMAPEVSSQTTTSSSGSESPSSELSTLESTTTMTEDTSSEIDTSQMEETTTVTVE